MKRHKFLKKTVAFALAAMLSLNISSLAFAADVSQEQPTSMTVRVVDEGGDPVEGVELYMLSTGYPGTADLYFDTATDQSGEAVYECIGDEFPDDTYSILPVESSNYTCDSPVEVTFGMAGWSDFYVDTVGGEPYDGSVVEVTVKSSGGSQEPGGSEPEDQYQNQRTLNVKVQDAQGQAVEDVVLVLSGASDSIAFSAPTSAEGTASYACGTGADAKEGAYTLAPAEGSGYTCESPAEVVLALDDSGNGYVDTVNTTPYDGSEVVLEVAAGEGSQEPGGSEPEDQYQNQRTLNVKVQDAQGQAVEDVALVLSGASDSIAFSAPTSAEGTASYACGTGADAKEGAYTLAPAEGSGYTCESPAEVVLALDDSGNGYVDTVNTTPYDGSEVVLEVVAGEGGQEPADPQTSYSSFNIAVENEAGDPVEGVALYLRSTVTGELADITFGTVTDQDGKAVYQCGRGSMPELPDDSYELLPTADSGYTCDTPAEITFRADYENDATYVNTVNGTAYAGEEVTIVVKESGSTGEPQEPSEPELQTALNVKVEDEAGDPVEGVKLYLRSTAYGTEGNIVFADVTDQNGTVVYTCDNESEMEDDLYELLPAEDSGYTTETPVEVTFGYDGTVTYVAEVGGAAYDGSEVVLTISASQSETPAELPFGDIDETSGDWYYDAVQYVYENGLMTGLNEEEFAPFDGLYRVQFAIILWRMNGAPEMQYTDRFRDVVDNEWYTDAVLWAAQEGVVTGYSNGNFGVGDEINREQMAVMMYRYAQYQGYDVSNGVDFSRYEDAANVSSFATDAMRWAVGNGIITGKYNETQIDPQGGTLRAECAIILTRYLR